LTSVTTSLAKQKDKEIEMLHSKVKSTIAKRDETIQSLTDELHVLQAKTQQQELLLEKQRSKLLK
jgi:5-azacytidine-induced protein 1